MLWKGNEARPLEPEEREALHLLPAGYTKLLKPARAQSGADARDSAIGNGFHIPSIILLLGIMYHSTTAATGTVGQRGTVKVKTWAEERHRHPVGLGHRGARAGRALLRRQRAARDGNAGTDLEDATRPHGGPLRHHPFSGEAATHA
eukprot:10556281-Heterocapsa_arctica.AAC.1